MEITILSNSEYLKENYSYLSIWCYRSKKDLQYYTIDDGVSKVFDFEDFKWVRAQTPDWVYDNCIRVRR